MSQRVKLADVAARAGVSVSAVSLVLNGKGAGNIAPGTRDRILAAVRELDYRPNSVAQSLRRNRTHAVGLITDAIASSPFAGRLVAGAMDVAAERGYVLLLVDSQDQRDREQAAVDELARRQVDGFLYATMGLRALDELPATRLPLVLANCYLRAQPGAARGALPVAVPSVIPDDVAVGRDAARHLLGLGHRRLAVVSGQPPEADGGGNVAGPLREAGFLDSVRAHGASAREASTVVDVTGWTIRDGYHAAMRLLADDGRAKPAAERPTAIFAVTDRVATGVLLAAAKLNLDVPRDLSVLGVDDQEELAEAVVPALTTVALPHREMGERAMGMLLSRLHPSAAHPSTGTSASAGASSASGGSGAAGARGSAGVLRSADGSPPLFVPCPLVVRDSTAAPSA